MSTTHVHITAPSKNYEQVKLSLVYRLSELTFGSLLAAYILGFIAAIAAHWDEMSRFGRWGAVLLIIQYAAISLTFAYLTTSLYLTYHAGILTMPQLPLDRLGIDFGLAIVQALFFGFSVLRPWSFLALLGISVGLAGYRQRKEHRELAQELYKAICRTGVRKNDAKLKKFRDGLADLLPNFPELSGWGPTGLRIWLSAGSLLVIGAATVYLIAEFIPNTWRIRDIWGLRTNPLNGQILITLEVVVVMVPIILKGHKVLKQRATFLQLPDNNEYDYLKGLDQPARVGQPKPGNEGDPEVDLQFKRLQKKLEELCTS